MKNFKILSKQNILNNLSQYSGKKVCAMVKSNAYGHGLETIVDLIKDEVNCFGVVDLQEAKRVRALTEKPIMICSKVDDFQMCKDENFAVLVESAKELKNCLAVGLRQGINLKIDCGMNRFGCKNFKVIERINDILKDNNISLNSICTHFSNTTDKKFTQKQYKRFCELRAKIEQDAPICFGGSGIFDYDYDFDILRLGIGLYGYGNETTLKPVLKIVSHISKIFYAQKGEFVGYGRFGKVKKSGRFAIVQFGYGDGLQRRLSGNFCVKINNKNFRAVGNVCMDCFFVAVDDTVAVGDEVVIMDDAKIFADKLKTISYEILTGFSNARAQTIVEN